MATVQELHELIDAQKERHSRAQQREQELADQMEEARERQRLQKQLKSWTGWASQYERDNDDIAYGIQEVNEDAVLCDDALPNRTRPSRNQSSKTTHMSCSDLVVKGQYCWKIAGMSWLRNALHFLPDSFARTPDTFCVGPDEFEFVYHPDRSVIGVGRDGSAQNGSLALKHLKGSSSEIRYKIFIQRNDSEFIQWGTEGNYGDPREDMVAGPDVQAHSSNVPAHVIFGLSHEQLLRSEWVHEDALTVKFKLEVLPRISGPFLPEKRFKVEIPPSSLSSNFLSLFETGDFSDITFLVKGESIKAHSPVLAARSQVFKAELGSGMRESLTKEVAITDCEPEVFKAILQFLYSDDFSHIEAIMQKSAQAHSEAKSSDSGGSDAGAVKPKAATTAELSFLQDVLAVSHKYQLSRLSSWCEQHLCERVCESEVCSLLRQAHLLDATVLEEVCLKHLKENIEKLAVTAEFARMASEWPELLLKLSLFTVGASASTSASSLGVQQSILRKRKREGDSP